MPQQDVSDMSPEEIAEAQKQNCIFCKIASGEVPSKKVYEDETMMAVHDIRPATTGHIVVFPKEHYPILPLVPEETFTHVFTKTRELSEAVRKAVPATGSSVFIANGAAAGQQSPHFLFHIIPRDEGDGLDALDLPMKDLDQGQVLEVLRQNVGTTMKKMLAKHGKMPGQQGPPQAQAKNQLAQILDQNPEIKQLLEEEPEKFKQMVSQNPQLKQLFQGVDIDKLSQQLSDSTNDSTRKGDQSAGSKAASKKSDSNEEKAKHKETNSTIAKGDSDKKKEEKKKSSGKADLDKVSRLFK